MNSLQHLRERFSYAIVAVIWINVALIALRAVWSDQSAMAMIGAGLLVAGAATFTWMRDHTGVATRIATSVAATLTVVILVFGLAGNKLQIDLHMYFFAMLAITAGWCDWRALAASTLTTAVHHILFNFTLPWAVYPGGADFERLVLHAVVLIAQFAILAWVVEQLGRAFAASDAATLEADRARDEAHRLAAAQEETARVEAARAREIRAAVEQFRAAVGASLTAMTSDVSSASVMAERIIAVSTGAAEQAQGVAAASELASGNVRSVAVAAEELSSSVGEMRAQLDRTQAVIGRARGNVDRTMADISELSKAATQIQEIVGLITAIAAQTNLLALNATIEAARAGDAGKGFAVVASEVKGLADQTRQATEQIASRAAAIGQSTAAAVASIQEIVAIMSDVGDYADSMVGAMGEQSSVTDEIARHAAEAAEGTANIARFCVLALGGAKETQDGIGSVSGAVSNVSGTARALSHEVEGFLTRVAVR
ncbi:methyl-accepting chemotaxis protein [Azorhizobium doebereinerae]|uniref:methyl-accepting chemotaxis protein n=1 Tax=Azorhizobium doebereinerae TaxID=281091 RepID=UPI000426D1F8|nr:methyl-accepting chemotaxis protein [Azorhizobium doebereinerae]